MTATRRRKRITPKTTPEATPTPATQTTESWPPPTATIEGGAWLEHKVQSDIGGWVELEISITEDERSEKDPLTVVKFNFPHLQRVTRTSHRLHDQSVYIAAQDLEEVAKAILLCAAEARRTGVLPPLEKFGPVCDHRLHLIGARPPAEGAA